MKIQASQYAQNLSAVAPPQSNSNTASSSAADASKAGSIGPAVILSLTNTSKAPDAAAGDPDHDGK